MITDIHSHTVSATKDDAITSFCMKDKDTDDFISAKYISAGNHPWYIFPVVNRTQAELVEQKTTNVSRKNAQ